MPVSTYLKAGLFVVAAAAVLFAAAGTVAIPSFWAYLAIFAVVMIVSFAALDQDLLRERMRPGGKKPPLALKVFSLVLFMHWIIAGLDRGRFHWSDDVPGWLQGICPGPRHARILAGRLQPNPTPLAAPMEDTI